MEMVGRKIAELRKNHNMTQLELADKMGISFQAVSNWERGNSMPDISKLPELAELFDVTVDCLLGEHSEFIECAVKGDIKGYLGKNQVPLDEIRDIAPMLKPSQVDEIVESENVADFRDIEDLLPFIGREVVNKIALKAAENREYRDLDILLPFVDKIIINDIARKMISEGENIEDIAPFVSKEIISELAEVSYVKFGLERLDGIAPFIPQEQLIKIAEQEYENRGFRYFDTIAPFLNRKFLNDLAQKAIQEKGIKGISNIAPFLDKNMLAEYVKEKYL